MSIQDACMKITRRQLRRLILEAMISPGSLTNNFGVFTDIKVGSIEDLVAFILYDVSKAKVISSQLIIAADSGYDDSEESVSKWIEEGATASTVDIMKKSIYGSLHAAFLVDTSFESAGCNGAWQIKRAAAKSGYGPTMYDIIMSVAPRGLVPDRGAVSKSARGVWQFYGNRRDDVSKKYLDDVFSPVTPDKSDDCQTYSSRTGAWSPLRDAMWQLKKKWKESTSDDDASSWIAYRNEHVHDLMSSFPPVQLKDPGYLDMSYDLQGTHDDTFSKLLLSHDAFEESLFDFAETRTEHGVTLNRGMWEKEKSSNYPAVRMVYKFFSEQSV